MAETCTCVGQTFCARILHTKNKRLSLVTTDKHVGYFQHTSRSVMY